MRAYQDDEIETIHVYMLRDPLPENQPQPQPQKNQAPANNAPATVPAAQEPGSESSWPEIIQRCVCALAVLLLSAFTLIPDSPIFALKQISVPAIPLPVVVLSASVQIVPTGVTTIPATRAHGVLTIYNGAALVEKLPAGFVVTTRSGIEITTDQAVIVPAANAPTFGVAQVAAHAVTAGAAGNIAAASVRQEDGSSLVIKNLASFSGGQDARTITYVTGQDVHNAAATARAQIAAQQPVGLLPRPCTEQSQQSLMALTLTWNCQYVTYKAPPGVTPIGVSVQGDRVILTVRVAKVPR